MRKTAKTPSLDNGSPGLNLNPGPLTYETVVDYGVQYTFIFYFVAVALRPYMGHGLLILEVSR